MVKTLLKSSSPEPGGRWPWDLVCSIGGVGPNKSNLLPNAFKWEIFWKVDFLNTVEAKVIILTWYVKTNEAMAINKFQRTRLTFDLSAKVAHIGVPSTYLNIGFSETIRPMEIKFHMKTPYDWLAKICTICYCHMTKMATKPIYGKVYLNIFFSGTKTPMAMGLTM